jgi:hypothetical protein
MHRCHHAFEHSVEELARLLARENACAGVHQGFAMRFVNRLPLLQGARE